MLSFIPEGFTWAILLLPVVALGLIFLVFPSQPKLAGYTAIGAIAGSFLLSLWALDGVIQTDGHSIGFPTHEWLTIPAVPGTGFEGLTINIGIELDGLTGVMLFVVTSVSLLVQIYSQGYMAGDGGYARYYGYLSLFTASMIGLVLAENLVMLYVFWEMVGLCSYLLIGFWFHRPAAAAAAKKAFLVTRFGDLGFLIAILLIYDTAGTFDIHEIQELALGGFIGTTTLTLFALGIFAGAAGKSAQVPLHVWLPDAMEGPTPVSALIHAATMVAAGVYLVARMYPVYVASPDAMHVVGAIGGVTAISAALIGLVMVDIKRVLAYSTISQLGYMMLALGVGAYVAAIFHLVTHAFFKALLFLGSGSVNHATNTFDMRLMGGLRRYMPVTFATFLIGSLSLSGIFPFAGFWSKDEILSDAWAHEKYLFFIALITAGFTAFYMFRAIFLTFTGDYHGGAPAYDHDAHDRDEEHAATTHHEATPHESPAVMAVPLLILAVPAIFIGAIQLNHALETLLEGALPDHPNLHLEPTEFRWGVAIVSTILPIAGIALAWAIYSARILSAERLQATFRPAHALLENKYYFDVLYERVIVGYVFYGLICGACTWFDRVVIDGAVNGVGRGASRTGGAIKYLQSGQFQTYGAIGFAGVVFAAILVLALSGS